MKRTISFIQTTLVGGVIGLIPIVIGIIIIEKVLVAIRKIITPWAASLGIDHMGGKLLITIVAILILIIFCFIAGLLMRSNKIKTRFPIVDNIAAQIIPGFEVMRAQTNERYGVQMENPWQAVLFEHENAWNIGFVVEKKDGLCTVFIPEAPKMDSGDIKIMREEEMNAIPIQAKEAYAFVKRFGSGAGAKLGLSIKDKKI